MGENIRCPNRKLKWLGGSKCACETREATRGQVVEICEHSLKDHWKMLKIF